MGWVGDGIDKWDVGMIDECGGDGIDECGEDGMGMGFMVLLLPCSSAFRPPSPQKRPTPPPLKKPTTVVWT